MRFNGIYRIRCDAGEIDAKAQALAIEQSVEMPLDAIGDPEIRSGIAGRVEAVEDEGSRSYRVTVSLEAETTGLEAGQFMNMLFGNSSLHDDISLVDVELPDDMLEAFGGPGSGIKGLRSRVGADKRPLSCSALKPQGLSPEALADLAYRIALGRIDYVKDDHGLADQSYSPYWDRVIACMDAVGRAVGETGHPTRYVPSLSGNLDQLRTQISIARDEGLDTVMVAPMLVGLPSFHTLTSENRDIAFLAHPAMAGVARIAPPLLLGRLFRMFGADAAIFPNHGGRFGYTPEICGALAEAARAPWGGLASSMPVPAGGMTLDRLDEIVNFYGHDVMILIGGGLLAAGDNLSAEALALAERLEALGGESQNG